MAIDEMDDLHLRIARVTEDLRTIQQELNCAAMQAPSDPELMEALNSLSETEPIETAAFRPRPDAPFPVVLFAGDEQRTGAWRQIAAGQRGQTATDETPKTGSKFLDQLSRADELMLLHHLADARRRKPN